MQIKRTIWPLHAAGAVMVAVALLARPAPTLADNGNASPTLSFFQAATALTRIGWRLTISRPATPTSKRSAS